MIEVWTFENYEHLIVFTDKLGKVMYYNGPFRFGKQSPVLIIEDMEYYLKQPATKLFIFNT